MIKRIFLVLLVLLALEACSPKSPYPDCKMGEYITEFTPGVFICVYPANLDGSPIPPTRLVYGPDSNGNTYFYIPEECCCKCYKKGN